MTNHREWVENKIDITIHDSFSVGDLGQSDLYIYENNTADGYCITIVSHELANNIDWENDAFYYTDDEFINTIIERILDMELDEEITIYDSQGVFDEDYIWEELYLELQRLDDE